MLAYVGRGIEYTGKAVKAAGVVGFCVTAVVGVVAMMVAPLLAASQSNSRSRGRDTHRRGSQDDGFFRGFSLGVIWSDIWTPRRHAREPQPAPSSTAPSSSWGLGGLILVSTLITWLAMLVASIAELPMLGLSCLALYVGSMALLAAGALIEMLGSFMYDVFQNSSWNPLAYVYECCVDFKNWCFPKNRSEKSLDSNSTVPTVPSVREDQSPVEGIPLGMGYQASGTFFQPPSEFPQNKQQPDVCAPSA
jgi:hypothetical protein